MSPTPGVRLALTVAVLLPLAPRARAEVGELPPVVEAVEAPDPQPEEESAPDPRIREQLNELGLEYQVDDDGDYKLLFETDGDRSQLVFVLSATNEYRGFQIREIWAYGYESATEEIPADVANRMLEDSYKSKLGSWVKIGNNGVYVSKIVADADPDTLDAAIVLTMEKADEMEAALTGDEDRF